MEKYNDVIMEKFKNTHKILDVQQVYNLIKKALKQRDGLSVVRIGDGEALTLAQQKVLAVSEIKKQAFLAYAGVRIPDITGRDILAASVRKADIVGIPFNPLPYFFPLFLKTCKAHNINLNSLKLTNACINYFLYNSGNLKSLLTIDKPKVLVIGNKGKSLAKFLQDQGVDIKAVISPVYGLKDTDRVVKITKGLEFELALVAAGVAAVVICERIANGQNRVALDIGHVADIIIRQGKI